MKLSECPKDLFIVERDGIFESLGILKHRKEKGLSFLESKDYLEILLNNPTLSCIITSRDLADSIPSHLGIAISDSPRVSFLKLHNYLATSSFFYKRKIFGTSVDGSATIHPTAEISATNVFIGKGCQIGPYVVISENSVIHDDVIIRSGSVIGTEGFYPKRLGADIFMGVHTGGVIIHDRVEVQANCGISKGIFGGSTEIGSDSKMANFVDIAHDVKIGQKTFIAAGTVVSGNTTIGNEVWIGPNCTITNNVEIFDNATVSLGSVVTKDVPSQTRVTGNFAIDHVKFLTFLKNIR